MHFCTMIICLLFGQIVKYFYCFFQSNMGARIRIRNNTHLNIGFQVRSFRRPIRQGYVAPGRPYESNLSIILHDVFFHYNGRWCRRWYNLSFIRTRTFEISIDGNKRIYVRETSSRSTCRIDIF